MVTIEQINRLKIVLDISFGFIYYLFIYILLFFFLPSIFFFLNSIFSTPFIYFILHAAAAAAYTIYLGLYRVTVNTCVYVYVH